MKVSEGSREGAGDVQQHGNSIAHGDPGPKIGHGFAVDELAHKADARYSFLDSEDPGEARMDEGGQVREFLDRAR